MENKMSIPAFDWKTGVILFLGLLAGQTIVGVIMAICCYPDQNNPLQKNAILF